MDPLNIKFLVNKEVPVEFRSWLKNRDPQLAMIGLSLQHIIHTLRSQARKRIGVITKP